MRAKDLREERLRIGLKVWVWIIVLFAITGIGVLPFIVLGPDLHGPSLFFSPIALKLAGVILAGSAPTLSALLVAGSVNHDGGLRPLLGQALRWRIGVGWYGVAFLAPIIILVFAKGVYAAVAGWPPRYLLVLPEGLGLAFLVPAMLLASFGQELGWRGYAFPLLQSRLGALVASLIIGMIWSGWQLCTAAALGGFWAVNGLGTAEVILRVVTTSILYGWMYNATHGSLYLVLLAHTGFEVASRVVPTPADIGEGVSIIADFLYLAAAGLVVWRGGARTLSG